MSTYYDTHLIQLLLLFIRKSYSFICVMFINKFDFLY